MISNNTDSEIKEIFELLNFTLSNKFIEKWRYKYSRRFIKSFQAKLLESFSKEKPLKLTSLYTHLTKKYKYNPEQVINFFKSIDIDIYYPIISGRLHHLKKSNPETISLLS